MPLDFSYRDLESAPRASRTREVAEMVNAEQFLSARSSVTQSRGAGAPAASGGDGVARPPRQRRRHSRLGQRRPTSVVDAEAHFTPVDLA